MPNEGPKTDDLPGFGNFEDYRRIIMTPELDPGCYEQVARLCDEVHQVRGGIVTLGSMASGQALIMDPLRQGRDWLRLVGVDLAIPEEALLDRMFVLEAEAIDFDRGSVREVVQRVIREADKSFFLLGDVSDLVVPEGKEFADVGAAINAVIYLCKEMLEGLYASLKPGGKAIVNTSTAESEANQGVAGFMETTGVVVTEGNDFWRFDCREVHDPRFRAASSVKIQKHPTERMLREVASDVGFSRITELEPVDFVVPYNASLRPSERRRFGIELEGFQEPVIVNRTRLFELEK